MREAVYILARIKWNGSTFLTRACNLKFESIPTVTNISLFSFYQRLLHFLFVISGVQYVGLSFPSSWVIDSRMMLMAALQSRVSCFQLLSTYFMRRRQM